MGLICNLNNLDYIYRIMLLSRRLEVKSSSSTIAFGTFFISTRENPSNPCYPCFIAEPTPILKVGDQFILVTLTFRPLNLQTF